MSAGPCHGTGQRSHAPKEHTARADLGSRGRRRAAGPTRLWASRASFALAPDDTVTSLCAAYREQCARSRRIAAERALDDVVPHEELGEVSLRWILVHVIDETARHAGHADILREQVDGHAGVW